MPLGEAAASVKNNSKLVNILSFHMAFCSEKNDAYRRLEGVTGFYVPCCAKRVEHGCSVNLLVVQLRSRIVQVICRLQITYIAPFVG